MASVSGMTKTMERSVWSYGLLRCVYHTKVHMVVYIALAGAVLVFSIIFVMLEPHGRQNDLEKRRITEILGKQKAALADDDLSKPLSERVFRPMIRMLSAKLEKMLPRSLSAEGGRKKLQNSRLKIMLHRAGMGSSVSEYTFLRFFVTVASAGIFAAIFRGTDIKAWMGALFGAYFGYVFMRVQLVVRMKSRRKEMEQQLPDILDLLSINVEAGLGFEQALLHVIHHFDGALVDELNIAYREMTMGRPRRDALVLFSERCGLEDVKSFVSAIIQAEQLGISIKNVLRSQAAAMRASRRNRIQEKAMKISVKILLPMVIFIFPVLFIVLMGPATIQIYSMFAR